MGYDTRKIWGITNEVIDRKQSRNANPATFTFRGRNLSSEKEGAKGFNNYFASIGKEMADTVSTKSGYEDYLQTTNERFWLVPIKVSDVEEIMSKHQPKLSCGLDTINNCIVKTASMQLSRPMCIIVNKPIRACQRLMSRWKYQFSYNH